MNWAGNARERAVKERGWGWYASHIGTRKNDGTESVYMYRWLLLLPFAVFGVRIIRLHRIMRSDADRHLHDHPFDFTSFLLSGGYRETTPCDDCSDELADCSTPHPNECTCDGGRRTRLWPRFSVVRKRAEDLHQLTLERPVWTLVFAGAKRRDWGFATESGWVPNWKYSDVWPERSHLRDVSPVSGSEAAR